MKTKAKTGLRKTAERATGLYSAYKPNASLKKYRNFRKSADAKSSKDKEVSTCKFAKDKKKNSTEDIGKKVKPYDIEKCLVHQRILNRVSPEVIKGLAKAGEVVDFTTDDVIVRQGDIGGDIYFVLYGSISVVVNGKKVATRQAKECIGEMTALDPTQKRSATLIAMEDSRLLKVKEEVFKEYVEKENTILNGVALELASRLREHTGKITKGNDIPNVFIGSSSEYSNIATKLYKKLSKFGDIQPKDWKNGVFELSKSNIESLCAVADTSDFGVFILSKDDLTKSRGKKRSAPRDNVLFEFGLFMGNLGRDRTFAICCSKRLKIPSDLDGVTFIMLETKNIDRVDITECVNKLRTEILKKGVR